MPGQPFSSTKCSRSVLTALWGRWMSLWLLVCCLFSPASAHLGPALSYCQQGHTPWQGGSKGYFLEENEVCLPEIVPVVKFSWTEEFLQQMRAIATATEFADPGIEEMDTVDNIAILVNHPGDRHWRFYRPDPHGFGRIRSMDLQVTTQMPLSDVQRRIEEHWPDLVGGVFLDGN